MDLTPIQNRTFRPLVALAVGVMSFGGLSKAATLYWDGTDTTGNADGGTGTWDTTLTNWDSLLFGGSNTTWNNVTPDSAIFGGAAGTVTLGTGITIGGLTFNTTGYIIDASTNALTFGATNNTIILNNIAAATITGSVGGPGNVILSTTNPATAATLTLNGTSAGGWSGTTTVNAGFRLEMTGNVNNQALLNTSGISLNGGTIAIGNSTTGIATAQATLNRINDSATITSYGGTIAYDANNSSANAETVGTLDLIRGQFSLTEAYALSSGSSTFTFSGLTRSGASNSSVVNLQMKNTALSTAGFQRVVVGGVSGNTAAGQIVGPWFTTNYANTASADYIVYSNGGSGSTYYAIGANIAGSAENTWTTAANAYTTSAGGTVTLTGTRTITALRNIGATTVLTLASGADLQTYGVLNGTNTLLTIAPGTGGVLTTPTGGGNLYVTSSAASTTISAPINDNGGAVTLVVSGGNTLTLSSTTSNYSGGTVLNSGTLSIGADTNLGSGGGLVINGVATLTYNNGNNALILNRSLTINDGAVLSFTSGNALKTFTGVVSGNGTLVWAPTTGLALSNTANTFNGPIIVTGGAGESYGFEPYSLGDSAGAGVITMNGGAFIWRGASASTVTFDDRQVALTSASGSIANNGTDTLVFTKDLLLSGSAGARTLTLRGTNAGANTFSGKISDGNDGGSTLVGMTKNGNGLWILSNSGNSYTGGTTVSAGTLQLGANNALGDGAVTVTAGTLQLGTFSDTVGAVNITGGTIDGSTGVLSGSSVNATGTSTISAILGGSGSLNRGGAGSTTSLTKANTYSGGTNVVGGTLAVSASGVLGSNVIGNGINIREQGILTLAASSNSGSNQTITIGSYATSDGRFGNLGVLGLGFNGLPAGAIAQANTNGGVIAINAVTGYNTDLSSVLSGKNLFLGAIGTSTFTGSAGTVVAGNGSLYRLGGGGGQITFNTTNLFTGANGVQAGSFLTNGGGTVVIQAAQDYSGATTVSAGTLTLSGASGTATGSSSFTLNGGRLFLDSSTTNNANRIGTVAVSLSTGGELSLSGNTSGTSETIGDLSIGAGSSIVTVRAATAASAFVAGAFSRSNNGTALFRGTSLGQNATAMGQVTLSDASGLSFVGASTLNNAANGDTTKDVRIIPYLVGDTSDTGNGTTFVTYDTTLGFRALHTTNQFNTTVTAGTNVRLAAAQAGIATTAVNSLIIANNSSSTIADGNTLTVTSGALLFTTNSGSIAPATTTGALGFGSAQGIITTISGVTGTISAQITGSGGLLKSGTGTLILSNANNNYTGGTIINAGTLEARGANTLGGSGVNLTFAGTGTLNYNPNPSAALNLGTLTVSAGVTATIKTGGAANAAQTYNFTTTTGSGTLAFDTDWNDTYNLGNASAFTGNIFIRNNSGASGHTVRVQSLADAVGSSVQFQQNSNTTTTNTLELTGDSGSLAFNNRQIQIIGSGAGRIFTPTLTNNNTTAANKWVINTDLLNLGAADTVAKNLGLAGSNTGDNEFRGVISNGTAGGIIGVSKSGNGTWILSGANTYTGGTTVSAGTLCFASGALGTTGAINASGGTLQWCSGNTQDISSRLAMTAATTSTFHTNGNNVTFASAIGSSSTGAFTKTGVGTLTFNGTNTFTGATSLNAGKLSLNYDTGSSGTNTTKLADAAALNLNGGTLELSGGSHTEVVASTTLNTGGTFITRPSGTATLTMGAITFTGGAIDFSADNIAATTTGVTNGILSQRATVAGANFAMKSGSNIVAYDYATSGSTGYAGAAMSANINYSLTANGASTLSGTTGATSNTLKIANTATGSLAVGTNTLTVGAILFAGSADYDITTSGTGRVTPSILHNYGTGGAVLNLGALGGVLTQFGTGRTILTSTAQNAAGVTVNGGTVQFSNNDQIGTPASGAGITLNNGTLLASETVALNNAGANHRAITLGAGGGTLAAAATKTLTVSGVISGALNPLTIGNATSSGTVALTGINTYSGPTTVNNGTLLVNGSINSATTVASGATLGGSGTINSSVTIQAGGTINPGNSPGTINIGNLVQAGTFYAEITESTGGSFDQINVTGTVNITGGDLTAAFSAGTYALNDMIFILLNDGSDAITGTYTGLVQGATVTSYGGFNWNISYTGDSTGSTFTGGNDIVLMAAAPIPEPGVAMLGGLSLLGLLLRRRRD